LAHCDDGVTWGRVDDGKAVLSSEQFPNWKTPSPHAKNLQQLRAFGLEGELLLWRDEDNFTEHKGRILTDVHNARRTGPTRPKDECYLIAARRAIAGANSSKDGFTVVTDVDGRIQVVPLPLTDQDFEEGKFPLRLRVRHYFTTDEENGCVRIAASRLVDLIQEPVQNQGDEAGRAHNNVRVSTAQQESAL
jgi:CRISPR-associated protein (TIGR03984 family)